MNKMFFIYSLFVCSCIVQSVAAPSVSQEEKVRCMLFAAIDDLPTAELKSYTVGSLMQKVGELTPYKNVSSSFLVIKGRECGIFRYSLDYGVQTCGKNMLELLALGTASDDYSAWRVVNVRMAYISESGITYYNNLIPESWPIERTDRYELGRPVTEQPCR